MPRLRVLERAMLKDDHNLVLAPSNRSGARVFQGRKTAAE
jgi:hypothetical protein